eukprot:CAMPEP_0198731766 /NCGR_PEP_ID=MMETSP1475-20131203/32039_1 /TAXON_ID= ORGANISM="Unidentified sp., Strain CCMP1999" /NCGR_SAMPLE_ID=MMETSP1475 /ASSEMBLY_ACC=CAM_ASM_001111 /LENGTH=320 /DNA_ID=CAMNT_0044494771 /DNA_START=175 /DNA_END=1140 /DNA_ORIENTATION=-
MVASLGCTDWLVGMSHECQGATGRKVVTRAKFDAGDMGTAEVAAVYRVSNTMGMMWEETMQVEAALVRQRLCSYFWTEVESLVEVKPEVVLTAVDDGEMDEFEDVCFALDRLLGGAGVKVININPNSVAQIWEVTRQIAAVLGVSDRANTFLQDSQERLQKCSPALLRDGKERPLIAVVQWTEPLYLSGTWIPELVQYAGGRCALASPGRPSVQSTWRGLQKADPDLVVFCLCGLGADEGFKELRRLQGDGEFNSIPAVRENKLYAVDARSLFSVPSPGCMVRSAQVLSEIIYHWNGSCALPFRTGENLWKDAAIVGADR